MVTGRISYSQFVPSRRIAGENRVIYYILDVRLYLFINSGKLAPSLFFNPMSYRAFQQRSRLILVRRHAPAVQVAPTEETLSLATA